MRLQFRSWQRTLRPGVPIAFDGCSCNTPANPIQNSMRCVMKKTSILKRPVSVAMGILLLCSGCSPKPENGAKDNPIGGQSSTSHGSAEPHSHEHAEGQHGGTIVSLGADSYHAEAILETNGTWRLFMLGRDETRVYPSRNRGTVRARPRNLFRSFHRSCLANRFASRSPIWLSRGSGSESPWI